MNTIYLDGFESKEDIIREFKLEPNILDDCEIIVACYDLSEAYSGDAFVLYKTNGVYYEVNDSHCSCNGLEYWEPEAVTEAQLKIRYDSKYSYGAFMFSKKVLKEHFGW